MLVEDKQAMSKIDPRFLHFFTLSPYVKDLAQEETTIILSIYFPRQRKMNFTRSINTV